MTTLIIGIVIGVVLTKVIGNELDSIIVKGKKGMSNLISKLSK